VALRAGDLLADGLASSLSLISWVQGQAQTYPSRNGRTAYAAGGPGTDKTTKVANRATPRQAFARLGNTDQRQPRLRPLPPQP